jgi:hypothetical protein
MTERSYNNWEQGFPSTLKQKNDTLRLVGLGEINKESIDWVINENEVQTWTLHFHEAQPLPGSSRHLRPQETKFPFPEGSRNEDYRDSEVAVLGICANGTERASQSNSSLKGRKTRR